MFLYAWHNLWLECIKELKNLEFNSLKKFAFYNKIDKLDFPFTVSFQVIK